MRLALLALISFAIAVAAHAAESIALFNGKDLSGWTSIVKTGLTADASTWTVSDGVLKCSGAPSGYVRTEKSYKNYTLTLEWRWSGPALAPDDKGNRRNRNSGVLVHAQAPDTVWPLSIEAQLMETNAGDIYFIGGTSSAELITAKEKAIATAGADADAIKRAQATRKLARQKSSSEKPGGEWNTYEITCAGDTLTLRVNGVEQNHATKLTVSEGFIALQSEGAPIEFRNVKLTPIQ